jgi:hypothetical protein
MLLGAFLGVFGFDRMYYMYYWQGGLKLALGVAAIALWRSNTRLLKKATSDSKAPTPNRGRRLLQAVLVLASISWIVLDIILVLSYRLLPANGCPVKQI